MCRIKHILLLPLTKKVKVVHQVKLYEIASMMTEEIILFLLLYSIDATVQSIVVIVSYRFNKIRSARIKHNFDLYYFRPQRKGKPIITIPYLMQGNLISQAVFSCKYYYYYCRHNHKSSWYHKPSRTIVVELNCRQSQRYVIILCFVRWSSISN